jgi:lipoprotein-releasing system permease protein
VISANIQSGNLAAIQPGSGRVAIGSRLAELLGAFPGSEIALISPEGRSTVVGTVPRIVSYTVGAIFEVGVYDYDKAFVIMPMEDAQTLLMMGDQVGMIAVFNILSSLIMLVRAKTRDIAILRTMGASRKGMMKVFVTVGVIIGSLGIILGLILGAIFLFFRQGVVDAIQLMTGQNLWDPSVRFLSELPSKTDPFEVTAIVLIALILSFLATLYPAWKAASTDPVQVLRYE